MLSGAVVNDETNAPKVVFRMLKRIISIFWLDTVSD